MTSTPPHDATIEAYSGTPRIVHISDIHGYIDDARSALLVVGEHDRFDPLVTEADGELHWAGNDYVLVVNGDLIDRGDRNDACMDLVARLQRQAPAERVRYHLGNHEMGILFPTLYHWPHTYSTNFDTESRREFLERVRDGEVGVAFEGYNYTYSHAGANDPFSVAEVNADARSVAEPLLDGPDSETVYRRLTNEYDRVFAVGGNGGRGPDAGLCWMDFAHLDESAPPQVVGHSQRRKPVRKGNVVCGNIIRMNQGSPGGEGVLIEEPNTLMAVTRGRDGTAVAEEV